jgi:hypothetical protein
MKTYEGMEVQLHNSWQRLSMEVSGQLHPPVAFPQEKSTPAHTVHEAEWSSEAATRLQN